MTSVTTKRGPERWLWPLSGMLLVMGLLLGVQVHAWHQNDPGQWPRGQVGKVLRSYQVQVSEHKSEIERLRAQLTEYENGSAHGVVGGIGDQLKRSKIGLGLEPMEGPGITLEVADGAPRPAEESGAAEIGIVHDWHLALVVNELWADGAEAISLNGQRIGTGSAIVCSGRLVQVNRETIPSPFVFQVIGDPKTLTSGLKMTGGLLDALRGDELKVTLTEQDHVTTPALSVSPALKLARRVEKKE